MMAEQRSLTTFILKRPLVLIALTGAGLAKLGATAAITSGRHATSRLWSRAIWSHPTQPDGLLYCCRHDDDQRAVALFDRAESAIVTTRCTGIRDDRVWFGQMLDRYGLALVD